MTRTSLFWMAAGSIDGTPKRWLTSADLSLKKLNRSNEHPCWSPYIIIFENQSRHRFSDNNNQVVVTDGTLMIAIYYTPTAWLMGLQPPDDESEYAGFFLIHFQSSVCIWICIHHLIWCQWLCQHNLGQRPMGPAFFYQNSCAVPADCFRMTLCLPAPIPVPLVEIEVL